MVPHGPEELSSGLFFAGKSRGLLRRLPCASGGKKAMRLHASVPRNPGHDTSKAPRKGSPCVPACGRAICRLLVIKGSPCVPACGRGAVRRSKLPAPAFRNDDKGAADVMPTAPLPDLPDIRAPPVQADGSLYANAQAYARAILSAPPVMTISARESPS